MNVNTERIERIKLAWAILWASDTKLVRHVRSEVGRIDRDVVLNCTNIARVFSLEGHSGGSASIVIPWIEKTLSWEPITPLTGEDDEWLDQSEASGYPLWQNKRCSRVFKGADGIAYDVHGVVFREPSGVCYTNGKSRTTVVFPYLPRTTYVDCA
jgi:hypothetical protein